MKFVRRARTLVAALATGIVAGCSGGTLPDAVAYAPPPPLALVALVDPTPDQLGSELRQLEAVIRASVTPNEAIVVMMVTPGSKSYTVRPGDSLSSIATSHGLTLAELEAANPQFGPVSGRNWSVIHSGEVATLMDPSAPTPLLLVTKAPPGPPPPSLVRLPREPSNPTDYQRAQYERTLATANATNASRIAAWRASAQQALVPWQTQLAAQLENRAQGSPTDTTTTTASAFSSSVAAGLATLAGLNGHRLLLLLGGGGSGPSSFAPRSLNGITLVVANVPDPAIASAWTSAGNAAGADSIHALDPALTQLQLAQIVNG